MYIPTKKRGDRIYHPRRSKSRSSPNARASKRCIRNKTNGAVYTVSTRSTDRQKVEKKRVDTFNESSTQEEEIKLNVIIDASYIYRSHMRSYGCKSFVNVNRTRCDAIRREESVYKSVNDQFLALYMCVCFVKILGSAFLSLGGRRKTRCSAV